MSIRDEVLYARAARAHLLDRISMDDESTGCVECRAKMIATVMGFTVACGIVGLVAYRIGARRGA